jgi:hypothetical protein
MKWSIAPFKVTARVESRGVLYFTVIPGSPLSSRMLSSSYNIVVNISPTLRPKNRDGAQPRTVACLIVNHPTTHSPRPPPRPPGDFLQCNGLGYCHRRLFVTENAVIRGAAPRGAEPEHPVFVLLGCSVHVVLRHLSGNRYALVGECHCQCVMDGEAQKNANVRNIRVR